MFGLKSNSKYEGRPPRYFRWQRHWIDLIAVHQALRGLVEARLPLAEGLLQLSDDDAPRTLCYTFYWLHDDIASGSTLARAMANQANFFPPFCVEMIRAGEESGKLEEALEALVARLEASLELRHRTATHGYYIGNLLLVETFFMGFILTFVMPQFRQIFASFGRSLNPFARFFMDMPGAEVVLISPFFIMLFWVMFQYSSLKNGFLYRTATNAIGNIPGFARLHRKRYLGDACAMIALLTRGGRPLHTALRAAGETSPSLYVTQLLFALADDVEEGTSLAGALRRHQNRIPRSMQALLSLSESSGNLPEGFDQLADFYLMNTRRSAHLLIEYGAPLALCLVGLIVSLFYLGLFLAVINLSTLVS